MPFVEPEPVQAKPEKDPLSDSKTTPPDCGQVISFVPSNASPVLAYISYPLGVTPVIIKVDSPQSPEPTASILEP